MSKGMTKAPSVPFEKLEAVAKSATAQARASGMKGMFAVAAKRTIQWRLDFNSSKRKSNATARKDQSMLNSFSVSKNVIAKMMAKANVNYDEVMDKAYAMNGLAYVPSVMNLAPKASAKVKAKAKTKAKSAKKTQKANAAQVTMAAAASQSDVDSLVADVLGN